MFGALRNLLNLCQEMYDMVWCRVMTLRDSLLKCCGHWFFLIFFSVLFQGQCPQGGFRLHDNICQSAQSGIFKLLNHLSLCVHTFFWCIIFCNIGLFLFLHHLCNVQLTIHTHTHTHIYIYIWGLWKVTGLVLQTIYFNSKQQTTWFPLQSNPPSSLMHFSILLCHASMHYW